MKWLKYPLALFAIFIVQFLVTNNSYATSGYDNVIKTGGTAKVTIDYTAGGGGCSLISPISTDITTSWASIVKDSSRYYNGTSSQASTVISAFNNALNSGVGWGLVQSFAWQDGNAAPNSNAYLKATDSWVTLYFSDSPNATFNTVFANPLYNPQLNMQGSWYSVTIAYTNNVVGQCNLGVTNIYHGTNNPSSVAIQDAAAGSDFEKVIFLNFNIAYPEYPQTYEGEFPPIEMPPAKYVAMGDSFSSGEGNYPFEYGTDVNDVNECHRSPQAYPRLLQNNPSFNLDITMFVACSGATTDDVVNGKYNEPPQINALSPTTQVATMTIGGNNIDFKDFARACVITSCAIGSSAYNTSWSILTNSSNNGYLPDKLDTLFAAIQNKLTNSNTGADVLIVGYPYVAKDDSWTPSCPYFSSSSAEGAEAIVDKLNQVISDAVTRLGDARFTFVDASAPSSPFTNHELCTDFGYFYGVDTNHIEYTFHPNVNGQAAYSEVVGESLN